MAETEYSAREIVEQLREDEELRREFQEALGPWAGRRKVLEVLGKAGVALGTGGALYSLLTQQAEARTTYGDGMISTDVGTLDLPPISTENLNNTRVATTATELQNYLNAGEAVEIPPEVVITAPSKITLPSDTLLYIRGTLQLANGVDDHILENSDTTNGNSNIKVIVEGTLDGNEPGQTDTAFVHGINFKNVTGFYVYVPGRVYQTNGIGILIDEGCSYGLIPLLRGVDCGGHTLEIHDKTNANPVEHVTVGLVEIDGRGTAVGTFDQNGVDVGNNARQINIDVVNAYNIMDNSTEIYGNCQDVNIGTVISRNSGSCGFSSNPDATYGDPENCHVDTVISRGAGTNGCRIGSDGVTVDTVISKTSANNNLYVTSARTEPISFDKVIALACDTYGVRVDAGEVHIESGLISENTAHGVYHAGGDLYISRDVTIKNNGTTASNKHAVFCDGGNRAVLGMRAYDDQGTQTQIRALQVGVSDLGSLEILPGADWTGNLTSDLNLDNMTSGDMVIRGTPMTDNYLVYRGQSTDLNGQISVSTIAGVAWSSKPEVQVVLESNNAWYISSWSTDANGNYDGFTIQVTDQGGTAVGAGILGHVYIGEQH